MNTANPVLSAPVPLPGSSTRLGAVEDSFAEVYEVHGRAVYYLALRWLGDAAQAEDAAHDVFLKAYRHWHDFRHEAAVRTWLYRITINHCKNLRSSWYQRNVTLADDAANAHAMTVDPVTPLRVAESRDLGRRIQRTLDALPDDYRLLLLLVADEELSYEQIAALTAQSADAVRGKLYRARKAFAAHFRHTE